MLARYTVSRSDLIGRFDRLGEKLDDYDDLLDALSPEDAALVARENFLSVLPK